MMAERDQIGRILQAVAEHEPVRWDNELLRAEREEREVVRQLRNVQLVTTGSDEVASRLESTGEFEIVRELGRGSMGIVYEAVQLSLNRRVALKVLPLHMIVTPHRLDRFEREAKALAALDHPNIVTVHNVESREDLHFVVMELVEGEILQRCIPETGLSLDSFFELAIPIADALSCAHQHGITHRDLKPANIMVTSERRVKILDFGLAKLRHDEVGTAAAPREPISITQPGAPVGTVPYMSPEQLEGEIVDSRSDLFSLGIVFYEMLTGQRPFVGGTYMELVSRVLREAPPSVLEIRSDLPSDLGRIIRHCMQKDPDRRYQTAKGLRNELEELKFDLLVRSPESSAPLPSDRRRSTRKTVLAWSLAAVASVVLIGGLGAWKQADGRNNRPLPSWSSRQLTSDPGWEREPVVSPDGRQIAYASQWGENVDIWLTEATGGAVLRLTSDPATDRSPTWFPDGRSLAFVSNRDGTDSIWRVPRLGGSQTLLLPNALDPAISPDGRRIAFARPGSSHWRRIHVAPIDDPTRATVLTDSLHALGDHKNPAWSFDGSELVYADCRGLWIVPAAGGAPKRLREAPAGSDNPHYSSDNKFVYFDSPSGGNRALWRVRVDGKELAPLTHGSGPETHPSLSQEGSLLTYATFDRDPDLTVLDLVTGERVRIRGTRSESAVSLSPDDGTIVFSSDRAGDYDLWVQRLAAGLPDGEPRRLTHQRGRAGPSAVSPDGKWVAYGRVLDRQREIWIVPLAGGPPRKFSEGLGMDLHPSWSPDGSRLAYTSNRSGRDQIWMAAVQDGRRVGDPTPITDGDGNDRLPVWSRDGHRIAFIRQVGSCRDVWLHDLREPSGPRRLTTGVGARYVQWDADGTSLWVGATWGSDFLEIRRLDLADDSFESFVAPLIIGPASSEATFSLSRNSDFMVMIEEDPRGDIWSLRATEGFF